MSTDLETNIVSVERINEYSETPTEVLNNHPCHSNVTVALLE